MTNEKLEEMRREYEHQLEVEDILQVSACKDILELIVEVKKLRTDLAEQCRINGMGSEREARLMAQVQELGKEVEELEYRYQEVVLR